MESRPDQEARRQRLKDLAKHPDIGSQAALGRALGYVDGAFVRQMIAGERPVSEKTFMAIEQLQGGKFRGWFSRQGTPREPPPPGPSFEDRMEVSASDWALLQDLRIVLNDEEIASIRARAKEAMRRAAAALKERI